jgi:hypothetical protein
MEAEPKRREPYESPAIRKIDIVQDELAVTGCKLLKGMGPTHFCAVNPVGICKQPGS